MNRQALLTRAASQALPPGSREAALARLALRQLWHAVFDPCPELSRRRGDDNAGFLDRFLEHAAQRRLSMDWTLHVQLLSWMESRADGLDRTVRQELLAASAARWANSDQTPAEGVLLHCSAMGDEALAGWKLRSAEEDARVVLVRLGGRRPQAGTHFALCLERRYPDEPVWRAVPS